MPAVTRKTDKGLPQYLDAGESDVFILSGAEDLVPVLAEAGGEWSREAPRQRAVGGDTYRVERYRPRTEGLFARVERWTGATTGEVHWRSISRDNVTTVYGADDDSRIFAPAGPGHAKRVYSWLICQSYDDKGNAVVYEYAAEDDRGVDRTQANERHRERTANRYLKRVRYGNRVSRLVEPDLSKAEWTFEVVFDYGEGHYEEIALDASRPEAEQHRYVLASALPAKRWDVRPDPFSSYRAGFEVRAYRRCRGVLMFHRFDELGAEPHLVRSTEFDYDDLVYAPGVTIDEELAHEGSTRFASFVRAVKQSGYVREQGGGVLERDGVEYLKYLRKSLPPLEFGYSRAEIQDDVRELDARSLENLPAGLDGSTYQMVDLDGEGVAGVLTEQAGAWFYKPSLGGGRFGPLETVAPRPSLADLRGGRQQLLDLAGDGRLDLVSLSGQTPGFYERDGEGGWETFRAFERLPNIRWDEPNLRFLDLNGDGHADVLVTEDEVFTWYESRGEKGFGAARRVPRPADEEKGPCLVLADAEQSIYLADMCGDGLTDLVRVRNGEVCYWPNLGYGRFGAKVSMDDAPRFDTPDQFNQSRVRLADVDGSGVTDIIYLGRDGARIYFNQSGNRWNGPRRLRQFPPTDNLSTVSTADLLGNGTACLVWSSPLPNGARRPARYINLMGGQKPHLLVSSINNLGAETRVEYAPSTKFYLADKLAGSPWITKLPFPVHVVERVETYDRVSGNRFVTRHAYHHGYFDGEEREFQGFGMVEQWDTEEFGVLAAGGQFPAGTNDEVSSHVPPTLTRTWFHTGVYLGRGHVSDFFAGLLDARDAGGYYREPGLTDAQAEELLLADTVLPDGLAFAEEREACRALKGSMLRQEVYALDGTDREPHPYVVTEQNFAVRMVQPRAANRHGVFFTHARETLVYHYERDPADPRLVYALTLEVDDFGNVTKEAAVNYGRRAPDASLPAADRAKQMQALVTFNENGFTNVVSDDDAYRTPLPCETRTYELTGLSPSKVGGRFAPDDLLNAASGAVPVGYEQGPAAGTLNKRLIEHTRTLYRRDDLTGALALGVSQPLALPFESYKLAFTPGLLAEVYGGRVTDAMLEDEGRYVHSEGDADWWMPSGHAFYSPDPSDTAAQESAHARAHFFVARRYRDPFHTAAAGTETLVTYDAYDLLLTESLDPLGNRVGAVNDYRVLQPRVVTDPNGNRSAAVFDALGMTAATVLMGKSGEAPARGDLLTAGFNADLTVAEVESFFADPKQAAPKLIDGATTRVVYDLTCYLREPDPLKKPPTYAATLARETHAADPVPPGGLKVQMSIVYSDGLGREVQKKAQAEPGPVPKRDAAGHIVFAADGRPEMTAHDSATRWVGSGRTVFNNKGKPVRKYEPFFTDRHDFEFDARVGVSPFLFYDPVGRVVATLHPNHTWEKVVPGSWRQETWDTNDTVAAGPADDPDVGEFFRRLPPGEYLPTWHALRSGGALGPREKAAALKAAVHKETPTVVHLDPLARPFLSVAHNRFKYADAPAADPPAEEFHLTRVNLDIEGNQREIIDALGRAVMRYDYDMLGARVRQTSADAGERLMLQDAAGKSLYQWDALGRRFRTEYDALRRPVGAYLREAAGAELLVERTVYGETRPAPESDNLRGKVAERFDQAGVETTDLYDFKGNGLRRQRRLAREYKSTLDWSGAVPLEPEVYTTLTRFDALNRPVEMTAPDGSLIRPAYNEANLLESLEADVRGDANATAFVTGIDYDAKGQRTLVTYGNGVATAYTYDPLTFRLASLRTTRDPLAFPADCPQPPAAGWPGCDVQNLSYTYDPAGNITHIRDDAQQAVYFDNRRVEPTADYTYDSLHRLIEATGREHLGLGGGGSPNPLAAPDAFDHFHANPADARDGNALGTYLERYVYDGVGNILSVRHRGSAPSQPGWRRCYQYAPDSNRLLSTGAPNTAHDPDAPCAAHYSATPAYAERYAYDAHGNMTRMPHLPLMRWDFADRLRATSRQSVTSGTPETTWYVYDAEGNRARKVTESQAPAGKTPTRTKERVYLGDFEIYREFAGDGTTVALERETLHVTDDKRLVALVETRTDAHAPGRLVRFQHCNHLGSSALELDDKAQLISYEEYYPYGGTSYQTARNQAAPKRYRYTGKERDEESGLYYFGVRYYAPWLGRWVSPDPQGLADGVNVFQYVGGNPAGKVDKDGGKGGPPDIISDILNREAALKVAYAGSWAMTAKSNTELAARNVKEAHAKSHNQPFKKERVQSPLGGAFLRMYLDHEVDPDVVKAAALEIKQEPEFKKLEAQLEKKAKALGSRLLDKDKGDDRLKEAADKHLQFRLSKKGGGIQFKYETNPIIGGVSDAEVESVKITQEETDKGTRIDYEINITFKDTYDFENKRTGTYDKYRKQLAGYLQKGEYAKFWAAFNLEASGKGVTKLERAEVFASFMYAIEKKGWTPGPLSWEVTIPVKGSILIPNQPKKKTNTKKHH